MSSEATQSVRYQTQVLYKATSDWFFVDFRGAKKGRLIFYTLGQIFRKFITSAAKR